MEELTTEKDESTIPKLVMYRPVQLKLKSVNMIISGQALEELNRKCYELLKAAATRAFESGRKKILTRDL